MRKLFEIFSLELKALVRSRTLLLLVAACVGWMLAFPLVMQGDGTSEGMRELRLHYSLGGVFAILTVSLLAAATGSVARERAARRLQLTLVRPVRSFAVALGKILAHVAVGAVARAAAGVTALIAEPDLSRPCNHVLSPTMPPLREEAKAQYERLMKDPKTSDELKKADKSVMLRIMENQAVDQYQSIPTNVTAYWRFDGLAKAARPENLAVRLRFTNQYAMRQDVFGTFALGGLCGVISNVTQTVLTVPLRPTAGKPAADGQKLLFANRGKSTLMVRPRKDIHVLVPADAFWKNLLRACVAMTAVLALVISFGVFLSAGLGRPVALFVAFAVLAVSEMSPSVVGQYPGELEADLVDRVGLGIARCAATLTRPVSSLAPFEAVAKDECVEPVETLGFALTDLVAVPLAFSLLAALVLPRKQEDS